MSIGRPLHQFQALVLVLFLFHSAWALPQKRTVGHKEKTPPQRPREELLLGEVTIYGENATIRIPQQKRIPQEVPPVPPLLGWRPFQPIPPTELQSPQLPRFPATEKFRLVRATFIGGTARTANGRLLFWKRKIHGQVGAHSSWNNTLGTHTNRFRHQAAAQFWAQYQWNPNWASWIHLRFGQNSFGFGTDFSSAQFDLNHLYPDWRKVQALQMQVSVQRWAHANNYWQLSYEGRQFPFNSETDFRYHEPSQALKSLTQEKTHVFNFHSRFTRGLNFSINIKAIVNTDRFQPPLNQSPSTQAVQNTQSFLRVKGVLTKHVTPQFLAKIGLNSFYFHATERTSASQNPNFSRIRPVAELLYTPLPKVRIAAIYQSGYRFQSHWDAFQENPFFKQDCRFNQLEFLKSRAQLGAAWEPFSGFVLKSNFSDVVIETYPTWVTRYFLPQAGAIAASPTLSAGLYSRTYLPRVHFNLLNLQAMVGHQKGKHFSIQLTSRFNKSSTIDTSSQVQRAFSNDIPEMPNLELSAEGVLPLSSKFGLAFHGLYRSARLVGILTNQPVILPLHLSEFFLLNVRLQYQFGAGSIFLGAWNLFDQPIEEFYGMWGDGRKFYAGMTMPF